MPIIGAQPFAIVATPDIDQLIFWNTEYEVPFRVYNKAATSFDPPHPKLTWAEMVKYSTITEFDLLRSSAHQDIHNLEWANARNWEATVCHLKTLRAQEEITQLNIKIKRLATWIIDEGTAFDHAIQECQGNVILNATVHAFVTQCRWLNDNLQHKLRCIYALPSYTGECGIGEHQDYQPGEQLDEMEEYLDEEDNAIVDVIFEGVVRLAGEE